MIDDQKILQRYIYLDVLLLYTHDIAAWVLQQGGQNGDPQEARVHLVPSMEIMDIFKQTLNVKLYLDKEILDGVPKYLIINSRMDNAMGENLPTSLTGKTITIFKLNEEVHFLLLG